MKIKKILALILAICLLGSLCACQDSGAKNPAITETKAPAEKTDVADPLTWDDINALPIANDSMSEDELRQLCVDFMNMTMLFPWTPSEQTDFAPSGAVTKTFSRGIVYGGTPYVANTMGNIYTMMEYYDERNGMLDLSGGMNTIREFSNQCSGSTFWAWQRVCNSISYSGTSDAVERNGCLRVGPYTYSDSIIDFHLENKTTTQVCIENGTDTMFESYALLKPADGIVNYTNAGHVRMISGLPNVVRDAAGRIDGNQSTVTYTDQDSLWYQHTQADGTPYEHAGGYNVEVSFARLFSDGYLPFTFAELNKSEPIEKSETTINISGESVNTTQLIGAEVKSNYSISDITIVIKDKNGNQVYRKLAPAYKSGIPVPAANVRMVVSDDLNAFTDGTYTVEISARIGTGEKPVVYTGTLVK